MEAMRFGGRPAQERDGGGDDPDEKAEPGERADRGERTARVALDNRAAADDQRHGHDGSEPAQPATQYTDREDADACAAGEDRAQPTGDHEPVRTGGERELRNPG